MSKKLIYTSYSPNTRRFDLEENIKLLFTPWEWYEGIHTRLVKEYFESHYPNSRYYSFNYARSALYHVFSSIEHKNTDEVIFQGLTCAAASLPAIWAGYKPVYVDIEKDSLSPSVQKISEAINEKTKFIVIQYTMGLMPDVEQIVMIAKEKGILVIEDCTHFLPYSDQNLIGSRGDFSVFSFGRDKVISGVDGGVLLVNNDKYIQIINENYLMLDHPPTTWLIKRLLFPLMWSIIKSTYRIFSLGKLFHVLFTKLGLLTTATSIQEKNGEKPSYIPALLPNGLARIAFYQLNEIDHIQRHRDNISELYSERLDKYENFQTFSLKYPPLRFPILYQMKSDMIKLTFDENIQLGDWYSRPVSPENVSNEISCYVDKSCPNAENISKHILNLPTHVNISYDDANRIIDKLIKIDKEILSIE